MTNSCWFCSRRINKLQSEKSTFCRWRTFLLLYYGQKLCNLKEGFFCLDVPIYEFLSSIKFKYTRWRNGYTSQTLSDKELSNIRGETNKTNEISLSEAHSLSSLHVYPGNMFHHCSYVKPYLSLYI